MRQFSPSKRRKIETQYVWEFMRRHRIFRIEDLLPLTDMKEESLRKYLGQLERAGYVKVRQAGGKRPKRFADRSYALIKNTGIIAPVWVAKQRRLYDRNTECAAPREVHIKLPVETDAPGEIKPVDPMEYDKGRILKLLEEGATDLLALSQRSGISAGRFGAVITALKSDGTIKQVGSQMGVPVFERRDNETA